jgi:hypothetical protein
LTNSITALYGPEKVSRDNRLPFGTTLNILIGKGEPLMRLIPKILVTAATFCTAALAVNVGESAPALSGSTYGGGNFNLAAQKGKVTILFFLGCT